MERKKVLGIALAVLWLLGILLVGGKLSALPPEERDIHDLPVNFPKVTNPDLLKDQAETVKIIKVARDVSSDYNFLMRFYDQLPKFQPDRDRHITQEQAEKFIRAYIYYRDEMKSFKRNAVGENVGMFRAIAFYGMIQNYHEVVRARALVKEKMTGDEFEWVRRQLMEAAFFSVLTTLDNRQWSSEEQKAHLEKLSLNLCWHVKVGDIQDGKTVCDQSKFQRQTVPRKNLEIFLDNYRPEGREGINWPDIHFNRPTEITFDRNAILQAAANNPP